MLSTMEKKKIRLIPKHQNGNILKEITITAPKKYFVGYDDNANPIYTTDYKQSQEYLQSQLPTNDTWQKRKQWSFERKGANGQTRPGLHGDAADLAKAAELGIGTTLAPLAARPLVGASIPFMETLARLLTPGSSFWMNPITKKMVTGTAMSEVVNLANKAISGYNTVGEGVGDLVQRATGWNPNNTLLGPLFTEALNPGWYTNPNRVMNIVGRAGNVGEEFVNDAVNTAKSYVLHPTYQTVYHGSPYPFNIKAFNRGTPHDLGLHVGPKDMAISAGQDYGSKTNKLYKLRIPKASTETIDIHDNGVRQLSEDFIWGRHPYIEGWQNNGYSFLSSNNKLLPKWLDEAGAKLTIKPDEYRGNRMWTENDAHINIRNKAFPNISDEDRVVADRLLSEAKKYENVWNFTKNPEASAAMTRINTKANDLLSRNGYKVIKYFNNNEVEGAANAFMITDPSIIDVIPDISLSKYKGIWNNYRPVFGQSRLLQSAPKIRTQSQAPIITLKNAASITPEQWTAAQDAAIARGDMAEAQRLRDLHFIVSAGKFIKNSNKTPRILYRGIRNVQQLPTKLNKHDIFGYRPAIFTTSDKQYAGNYTRELYSTNLFKPVNKSNIYTLYGKIDNPQHLPNGLQFLDNVNYNLKTNPGVYGKRFKDADVIIGHDTPLSDFFEDLFTDSKGTEYLFFNPNNLKSSKAVTYDDNGVRIPLGKRDNFKLNDIRWGLLPFASTAGFSKHNNK